MTTIAARNKTKTPLRHLSDCCRWSCGQELDPGKRCGVLSPTSAGSHKRMLGRLFFSVHRSLAGYMTPSCEAQDASPCVRKRTLMTEKLIENEV